jgi:hypothetical protein
MNETDGRLALSDFLADLREELSEAQSRTTGSALKLGVEEITLTLDVAYTLTKTAEASAKVKAKFFVMLSAALGATGSVSSDLSRTHQLTLVLKPRLEQTMKDEEGRVARITRGVDVQGALEAGEEYAADPASERPAP